MIPPGLDTSLVLYDFQHDVNRQMISKLRQSTSMVVIEAQAAGTDADTFSLAEFADTALIVVEAGATSRQDVAETLQRLDRLRTPVLGALLVPRFGTPDAAPVDDQPKVRERASGPGDARSARSSEQDSAEPVRRDGSPEITKRKLDEKRPLLLPVQQAVTDRPGSAQYPSREGAKPNGTNAED